MMLANTLEVPRAAEDKRPGRPSNLLADTVSIKSQISVWLFNQLEGTVQTGPFQGMKMIQETAWDDYLSPYLLGCYEEELHGEFERQIRRLQQMPNPRISVLGCAEGYYAIGLKRRVPHAEVFAIDKDEEAIRICARAAEVNGVELTFNATVGDYLDSDLLVLDVEGNEIIYLDPELMPKLLQMTAIVEIHDWPVGPINKRVSELILDRFRGTHHIVLLTEGGRNPNRYPALCHMTSDYRWLAVSEGRPTLMGWYVMEPKGSYMP
jgi:hypothetical protein